ncbi:MAG: hypothetical protein KDA32_00620 [Phycisphaerales bacterium]|nr:hypothetical protein [Phycisphaerales bacterium]
MSLRVPPGAGPIPVRPRAALCVAVAVLAAAGGCLTSLAPDAALDIAALPNGLASVPAGQPVAIHGDVPSATVDSFTLGTAKPGLTFKVSHGLFSTGDNPRVAWLDSGDRIRFTAELGAGVAAQYTCDGDEGLMRLAIAASQTSNAENYDLTFVASNERLPESVSRGQHVKLNFAGGRNIHIADRVFTFSPFDATVLGAEYADQTERVRDAIEATLAHLFADYEITFETVTGGRSACADCATLHFGASDDTLVGLADSIDAGNTNHADAAIIFTDKFSTYATMRLTPKEIGRMIGNTAAHELGHLLGLAHAAPHDHIMDAAGGAWDLAGPRNLERAPVSTDVFPVGELDPPAYLTKTLGERQTPLTARQLQDVTDLIAATASLDARLAQSEPMPAADLPGLRCGLCGGQ